MANPWQMLDARETGANRTRTPKSGASSETVNQGPCEGLIGLLQPCAVKVASTVLRGGGDSDDPLTRPGSGCWRGNSFNPHRLMKAGAAPSGRKGSRFIVFQSSPADEGRCCRVVRQGVGSTGSFQSSPADEGRCCVHEVPGGGVQNRFNPHRPMKAGAAFEFVALHARREVSILTGR